MAAPSVIPGSHSVVHVHQCSTKQRENKHEILQFSRLKLFEFKLNLNEKLLVKKTQIIDLETNKHYHISLHFHTMGKYGPVSLWACHLTNICNHLNSLAGVS